MAPDSVLRAGFRLRVCVVPALGMYIVHSIIFQSLDWATGKGFTE